MLPDVIFAKFVSMVLNCSEMDRSFNGEKPWNNCNSFVCIELRFQSSMVVSLIEKLQSIDWDFSDYENSENLKGKKSNEVELPN